MKPHNDITYLMDFKPVTLPSAQSIEDLQRQLVRIETRLVKLMQHMGLDAYGDLL